ncbi:MAG: hypothetical protein BJ554DRAFT_7624, partial [Olpidium bornovanus]
LLLPFPPFPLHASTNDQTAKRLFEHPVKVVRRQIRSFSTMGSSDSGGGGDELSVILGYDPWSYPHFPYAVRCWSFVIFGWCVYELLQCGAILIGARAKRRSGAFRSIGAALVFEAMSTILDMVIAGYKNDLFDLPLDKPAENVIDSTGMAVAMAAKCAYVLATVKIIVTVFETSRTLRVVVYATAILALITIIIGAFAVSLILYVAADDYLTYVTTSDINQEISDSTKNTVGFTTYAIASSGERERLDKTHKISAYAHE